MFKSVLPYPQVPQLSKTDLAYATGDTRLTPFYTHSPAPGSFEQVMLEKKRQKFPRVELVEVLTRQYQNLSPMPAVQRNLDALADENTFTIVTAHQPSLLLGPMYFVYKALTTINLAEAAETQLGDKIRVVPVFVLGSEDHDLDELNKANLYGKQLLWQPGESGAVGSMRAESLAPVLAELRLILGESEAARALFARVERCCLSAKSFAEATRALLHEFLGRYGLLVLDMNEPALKKHFAPVIKAELAEQPAFRLVGETIGQLAALGFKPQAAPREINLFYMQPGLRERIVQQSDETYAVLNTGLVFSHAEIMAEVDAHPERFSPNVVLRPLYQETVLPNLAYVGGGGELAYWLERKSLFAHFDIPFPMLVRRHSVLWLDADAGKKLAKLDFSAAEIFGETEVLVRSFVEKNAAGEVSLEAELVALKNLFEQVAEKAKTIDPTLEKAVLADSVKAASGLEQWQSRLMRAEKQKHETALNQLRTLKEKLFPGGGLQERHDNFLPYVLKYGDAFFDTLITNFNPFDPGFLVIGTET